MKEPFIFQFYLYADADTCALVLQECTDELLNAIILVQHTHKLKAGAQTRHSNAICNSKAEPHTHKNFTLFYAITLT